MTTPSSQVPSFGDKRKAAMAVYTPPFKYRHGYIFDSQNLMVADNGGINDTASVEGAVAARVRGWGRLGYQTNGAELQDEIGQMMAEALNALYANIARPVKTATWRPEFDAASHHQEQLAIQFCTEIAGPKGQPGSPPDLVRLLEMAQALYEAERDDLEQSFSQPVPSAPEPVVFMGAMTVATRNMAIDELNRQQKERKSKALRCEQCSGEGRIHHDGRDAQTGHRICVCCQGLGIKDGWDNPAKLQFYYSEEDIFKMAQSLSGSAQPVLPTKKESKT